MPPPDGPAAGSGLPAAGHRLGPCVIERQLGRGGMGAVYLARHRNLDVPVAVKVISPQLAGEPELAERFLREGKLAARLKHPNVVGVLDVDRDPASGLLYMVQEYVDGGSLAERLATRGVFSEQQARVVATSVTRALIAIHQAGIVHRDIKPDNILFTAEGKIKLGDLGLARESGPADSPLTRTHSTLGTPAYMSPEQVRSSRDVDIRSDIYSLGATLYHLLTGRLPFSAEGLYDLMQAVVEQPAPDPRAVRPELSPAVSTLCLKMMAKDPADRFQTPEALVAALVLHKRQEEPDRSTRPAWLLPAAGGALLLLLIGLLLAATSGGEREREPEQATSEKPAGGERDWTPGPDPLARGLVLAVDFEDGDRVPRDLVTQQETGQAAGPITYVDGKHGRGLFFDGRGRVTLASLRRVGAIALWCRPAMEQQAVILDWGSPHSPMQGLLLMVTPRRPSFAHWQGGTPGFAVGLWATDVLVPAETSNWRHLVVAVGPRGVTLMVDGEFPAGRLVQPGRAPRDLEQPVQLPSPWRHPGNRPLLLGGPAQGYPGLGGFHGTIDELLVWDRALSRKEMAALYARARAGQPYAATLARFCPGPLIPIMTP